MDSVKDEKFGKIREVLLKSGVPLELSISKKLQEMDYLDLGEYYYKRGDKTFSADLYFRNALHRNINDKKVSIFLDLIIESKYRRQSKKWFFTPFEFGKEGDSWQSVRESMLDTMFKIPFLKFSKLINELLEIRDIFPTADMYQKGFEIQHNDVDTNCITEAISQVLFATSDSIFNFLDIEFDEDVETDWMLGIFVPIIVTTAELFVFKKSANLESIHHATNLSDIAKKVDSVFICMKTPLYIKEYNLEKYSRYIGKLKRKYPKKIENIKEFDKIIDFYSRHIPGRIFVINYEKLDKKINQIEKYYFDFFEEIFSSYK